MALARRAVPVDADVGGRDEVDALPPALRHVARGLRELPPGALEPRGLHARVLDVVVGQLVPAAAVAMEALEADPIGDRGPVLLGARAGRAQVVAIGNESNHLIESKPAVGGRQRAGPGPEERWVTESAWTSGARSRTASWSTRRAGAASRSRSRRTGRWPTACSSAVAVNAESLGLTRAELLARHRPVRARHDGGDERRADPQRRAHRPITTRGHEDAIIIGKVYAKSRGPPGARPRALLAPGEAGADHPPGADPRRRRAGRRLRRRRRASCARTRRSGRSTSSSPRAWSRSPSASSGRSSTTPTSSASGSCWPSARPASE